MATFNLWVKRKKRGTRCIQQYRYNRVKLQNSSEQQEDMLTNTNSSASDL